MVNAETLFLRGLIHGDKVLRFSVDPDLAVLMTAHGQGALARYYWRGCLENGGSLKWWGDGAKRQPVVVIEAGPIWMQAFWSGIFGLDPTLKFHQGERITRSIPTGEVKLTGVHAVRLLSTLYPSLSETATSLPSRLRVVAEMHGWAPRVPARGPLPMRYGATQKNPKKY